MRVAITALVVLVVLAVSTVARAVNWEPGTLEETLVRARAGGQWVLVEVGASWCGPCHEMDEKVWPREEVGRALGTQFLALWRDGERGEGEKIVSRYHVVGYPTLLILDANGAEVDRVTGFVAAKDLVTLLRDRRAGKGTLAEQEKRLQANPTDEALRLEVGTKHALRGDARALDELETVARGTDARRAPQAMLVLGKYWWLRGKKDYARAAEVLRALEKRWPQSEAAQEAPFQLGLALQLGGKSAEARTVLDGWIAAAPKDSSRYSAVAWMAFHDGFDRVRGIEVARAGLEVNPKDDGLWDTLAELWFAAGKPAEAREAEKRALALKPGDAYYEAQLKRFGGLR